MGEDGNKSSVVMSADRVIELTRFVLRKRFPGEMERQLILPKGADRVQFCCPFCGDSADPRKKRGNMYLKSLHYKCYNGGCEKYTDFLWFMKSFDCYNELTEDEKVATKLSIDENKMSANYTQQRGYELNIEAISTADFSKVLVPRSDFMKRVKLWNIHPDSPTGVYLTKRRQPIDNRYAWDNFKKRLFIFNLDRSGEWIFGMQIKQFGDAAQVGVKYKTYEIEDIWSKFMRRDEPAFLESLTKLNHLSTIFGILQIDLNRMVTIFEGPLDHFVSNTNSAATCSINNAWPFDMENKRWMQDNDKAGRNKAMQYLEKGDSVFMWSKFLTDNEIPKHKVKDLNDLRVYEWANSKKYDFEGYFTEHKLDGINI